MDDHHASATRSLQPPDHRIRRRSALLALALLPTVWTLGGCSLFVMGGKMLFGDPQQEAAFKKVTRVDLTKGEHEVLVVVTTPHSVKHDTPGADLLVTEQVSRLLENEGVKMFPSKKVLNWVDDRGGHWGSPQEIAEAFPKVDYILQIEIEQMSHREENSPDLFRGRVDGNISAYEVDSAGGGPSASPVFSRTFKSTYPSLYPKQAHQISERTFQKQFLDRVCLQIAQTFYDYPARDAIH